MFLVHPVWMNLLCLFISPIIVSYDFVKNWSEFGLYTYNIINAPHRRQWHLCKGWYFELSAAGKSICDIELQMGYSCPTNSVMCLSLMDHSKTGFWFTVQPRFHKLTLGDLLQIIVQSLHIITWKINLNWPLVIVCHGLTQDILLY